MLIYVRVIQDLIFSSCLFPSLFSRFHILFMFISVLVLKDPFSPRVNLRPSSQGSIFSSCLSQSQFSRIHLLLVFISVLVLKDPSSPVCISVLVLKDPSSPRDYLSPSSQGSIFSLCLSQSQFSRIHLPLVIISVLVLKDPSSPVFISVLVLKDSSSPRVYLSPSSQGSIFPS